MGIGAADLRQYIIGPTLKNLNLWSLAAENLLLGTAAQESKLGSYLHQINGPALGLYQIEPNTHSDLWGNFLNFRPQLSALVRGLVPSSFNVNDSVSELIWNLSYATAIARLIYERIPAALPDADDIQGLGAYWKQYYNTSNGAGDVSEFVENYQNLIHGQ